MLVLFRHCTFIECLLYARPMWGSGNSLRLCQILMKESPKYTCNSAKVLGPQVLNKPIVFLSQSLIYPICEMKIIRPSEKLSLQVTGVHACFPPPVLSFQHAPTATALLGATPLPCPHPGVSSARTSVCCNCWAWHAVGAQSGLASCINNKHYRTLSIRQPLC